MLRAASPLQKIVLLLLSFTAANYTGQVCRTSSYLGQARVNVCCIEVHCSLIILWQSDMARLGVRVRNMLQIVGEVTAPISWFQTGKSDKLSLNKTDGYVAHETVLSLGAGDVFSVPWLCGYTALLHVSSLNFQLSTSRGIIIRIVQACQLLFEFLAKESSKRDVYSKVSFVLFMNAIISF